MAAGHIKLAGWEDMDVIGGWLHEAQREGEYETLVANWHITQEVYERQGVLVFIEEHSNLPIAYFWGSLNTTSSILDVKPSHRKLGIGKIFVDYLVERAKEKNEPLLLIECAPESSEHFWQKMGFTTKYYGRKLLATRILNIDAHVQPEGDPIHVTIRFLNDAGMRGSVSPLAVHELIGIRDVYGDIYLPHTVAHFSQKVFGDSRELSVDITLGSEEDSVIFFSGRCTDDAASDIGIEECKNGYRINSIYTPIFEKSSSFSEKKYV